jgi:ethanolamine utilization protein EutJ
MISHENIELLWKLIQQPKSHTEPSGRIAVGIDVGTANVVSVAVDESGTPRAGVLTASKVVREGLIVDYHNAVRIVSDHIEAITERLGRRPLIGASAIPPNTEKGNFKVTKNVLESVGLDVIHIVDEPTAAALALGITDGIVVDVGGGTTGVSILNERRVVHTADEPTGGFQMDLVIAGHYGINVETASAMKLNADKQKDLLGVLRPVFEKVASITMKNCNGFEVDTIYMAGGPSAFPGFAEIMREATGKTVVLPTHPLLVTPLGIALSCVMGSVAAYI